ncbi:Protein Lines like protein, partial [Fukomys damarensis]
RHILEIKMNAFYEVLDQLYKKVLLGATLESDSHKYVFYLNPALSDQECATTLSVEWPDTDGVQDRHQPPPVEVTATPAAGVCVKRISQTSSVRETKLLQLTVIHVMISRVVSVETEIHAQEKYRDITKILLHSAEVDCKLITLSSYWSVFCQKNLSEYSESNEVMHCLWILIAVIKEVFKDTCSEKAEILKQFLTTFDNTFEVFYSSLFSQHFENCQDPSKIVNSLVSFLDLLELLIASRIYLKLHFRSQRVLFLKPSCVLDILTWPIQAFVKRKLMIFIKKCLLCKVGEDLCHASVLVTMSPDHHLDVDMLALANAVLHTVNLGLLKTWSVDGKWPCFGGKEVHPGCGDTAGPDHVLLRAASLVIMKSLEIKFRNYTSVNEMKELLKQDVMSSETHTTSDHSPPSPHASHTLVDYDSSDDSGAESMDQHVTNSQQTSYNPQASRKIQDPAGTSRYKKELSLQPQSSPLVPKQSAASFSIDCAVAPNNIVAEEGIFYRIVKCFEELQGAIYRLQTKNLFPYNPAALLKLLKCMEVIYSKSVSLL